MDFLQLLSWACIVFTVGMFSTGLTDLKTMRESKSTDNIQFLPFLTTCLNNLGWLFYGMLKRDQTIVLVNIIGALLQILYIIMYLHYTKHKGLVMSQTVAAGTVLTCGWLYFGMFLPDGDSRLSQLGLTCSVVTVSMYMSPLTDLPSFAISQIFEIVYSYHSNQSTVFCILIGSATVASVSSFYVEIIRSGNVQCLSFPLTVATFFTSTSWVLYGLQLNDYYIVVPNTPGIFTSLVRFYLFWRFASVNQGSPSYKPMHI